MRFKKRYHKEASYLVSLAYKARREGLLSLSDELTNIKDRFLLIGLNLIIDGTDRDIVEKVLDNLIKQEVFKSNRKIREIQKSGLLSIQCGNNPRVMLILMNSYVKENEILVES